MILAPPFFDLFGFTSIQDSRRDTLFSVSDSAVVVAIGGAVNGGVGGDEGRA